MIKTVLQNENVELTVSNHGAEMHGLLDRKTGTQYIWQGDATYWHWHAPICFPITGRVHDDTYSVDGKGYHLTVHGFARDNDFDLLKKTENSLIYELKYSDETLKLYPYKFSLKLEYVLQDKGVKVNYYVENLDDKDIFFAIGLHTAYNCPMDAGDSFEDYELVLEQKETLDRYFLENGILPPVKEVFLQDEDTIPVTKELFKRDIVFLQNVKSKSVMLKSRKSGKAVKVSYENFDNLGFWTKPQGAPFICIEPWKGLADKKDKHVDFSQKDGNNCLKPGQVFTCSYEIEII